MQCHVTRSVFSPSVSITLAVISLISGPIDGLWGYLTGSNHQDVVSSLSRYSNPKAGLLPPNKAVVGKTAHCALGPFGHSSAVTQTSGLWVHKSYT